MMASIVVSIDVLAVAGSSSNNVGASSLEMFQKSWQTYKAVVTADLMEHASMTKKISEVVHIWMEHMSISDNPSADISIADIGCGDLALLGPLYKSLPLKSFHGVDMSLSALNLAQKAFQLTSEDGVLDSNAANIQTKWINEDLLRWAGNVQIEQTADGDVVDMIESQQKFDIIICAFSVHHLNDEDKIRFLQALKSNKLKPKGMILMADIFRTGEEDRESYLTRFGNHIQATWNSISETDQASVLKHVRENDYPASLKDFVSLIAPACDLSCEVVWGDTANFEKLVVLRLLK